MDKKINIFIIIGTRPEVIKMASIIKELENRKEQFNSQVITIAQHRQMLDQMLEVFNIHSDIDLNIMQPEQTLLQITIRAMEGLDNIFNKFKPDIILVQGDTTTIFAVSLVAFYHKIKIGHVEAGLRTWDKFNPYPEEINRHLTSVLADLHFAPTISSKHNLLRENIDEKHIIVTGNTVVDALLMIRQQNYEFKNKKLKEIKFNNGKRIILVTSHRRENFGKPLYNICQALLQLVKNFDNIEIIYPVHLNPEVRKTVFKLLSDKERIHLFDPLDYQDFVNLMDRSYLILTDSGGIQEEAPSLGKPVLVLRKVTERPEASEAGMAKIVGAETKKIVDATATILNNKKEYEKMTSQKNPYGDGKAGNRIVEYIWNFLN
ncbi:MAG: UDP-N-acetylglucosamine 2-epimerase (non-hydrolyzing) [bacterium]